MGEARRRKLAGDYPVQTAEYRGPRTPKYKRRFFGALLMGNRVVVPGSNGASTYERDPGGSLRRVKPSHSAGPEKAE